MNQKRVIRTSVWALAAVLSVGVFMALSSSAFFVPGEEPQNGEWVKDTYLTAVYLPTCTPNGCIEWCNYSANGLNPSGKLCCSDSSGQCIQSTIFYP